MTKTIVISPLKVAEFPEVPQFSETKTVSRPLLFNARIDSEYASLKIRKTEAQGVGIIG